MTTLDEWEEKRGERLDIGIKKNEQTEVEPLPNEQPEPDPKPKKKEGKTKDKQSKAPAHKPAMTEVVSAGTKIVAALEMSPAMTATSWDLPEHFTQAQFEMWIKKLKKADSGLQWWHGDLWLADRKQGWWEYGEGQEYAEKLGVNYQTIRDYASVCKAFEPSSRNDNLSFNHHRAVAS